MRSVLAATLLLLFAGMTVRAGEIYGTITEGGKPVAAGVRVEIKMGEKTYAGETDKFGSYRIVVKEKGKGTLTVTYDVESASLGIVSYDRSTRYDCVLETKEGRLSVRRE